MKNSFYKLLLIFSVKDIRWSLPMDRELDSLLGMVLVLEKEDKWVYFVYVQFHAVTTWSMNCYFVYVDNNQEWWPFSLGCKFTSFSWLQKHLPRFHFKTMWYHLCFPLPQPCETTQDLELLWHFINLWSLGRVWQLVRACKRTYMVDRTTLKSS